MAVRLNDLSLAKTEYQTDPERPQRGYAAMDARQLFAELNLSRLATKRTVPATEVRQFLLDTKTYGKIRAATNHADDLVSTSAFLFGDTAGGDSAPAFDFERIPDGEATPLMAQIASALVAAGLFTAQQQAGFLALADIINIDDKASRLVSKIEWLYGAGSVISIGQCEELING